MLEDPTPASTHARGGKTNTKENIQYINNVDTTQLRLQKRLYPLKNLKSYLPFRMGYYRDLENNLPHESKKSGLENKLSKCQGAFCYGDMKTASKLKTNESESNQETQKSRLLEWLSGVRFNIYHLVFYLIRELEENLYKQQRQQRCFNRNKNSSLVKLYKKAGLKHQRYECLDTSS